MRKQERGSLELKGGSREEGAMSTENAAKKVVYLYLRNVQMDAL